MSIVFVVKADNRIVATAGMEEEVKKMYSMMDNKQIINKWLSVFGEGISEE